jgi:Fe2+ transport system protein FeoA
LKSLDQLGAGERAYIVDMKNPLLCEKLFELGIFPGAIVEVRENIPSRSSILVQINERSFNIYRYAAQSIITHVVHLEFCLN